MAAALRRMPILAALGAVLLCAAPAAAADWRSCGGGSGARCTRVVVPLDRTGALAGSISLRVARVPGPAAAHTLLYLSGGPGSAGLDELESVLWSLPGLTGAYRVVTFDQRGTGGSGLLRCPSLERDPRLRSTAAAAACAARLGPARAVYTTAESVEDLEAVRQALGVDRLTLLGISYGTELALAYARAHPDRVERLALDSVADPAGDDSFALAGLRAMGPSLASLCPAPCVSPDPGGDLARLAARLRAAPMTGRVYDASGRPTVRRLTEVTLADLLYDTDYAPATRAATPAAIQAALAGDPQPLVRLAAAAGGRQPLPPPQRFSSARYATTCEETPLPWDPGTPIADRWAEATRRAAVLGPAAFAPFDFATAAADEIDLCLRWPGVPRAGTSPTASYPAVPVLLLQGGEDLRTPPEVSAGVAAELPGATRIVIPGVGHGVLTADPTGCAADVLLRFLDGDLPRTRCPRVPTHVPALAAAPRRLADVAPLMLPGVPARVRRTAAAVGLTLDDLRLALSPAFPARAGGGLRGGSYRDALHGLRLHRYAAIAGVALSGGWHGRRLRLRVTGSAAAAGRLTVRATGAFSGVLRGLRVAGRLPHRPPRPVAHGGIARASIRPGIVTPAVRSRVVPSHLPRQAAVLSEPPPSVADLHV